MKQEKSMLLEFKKGDMIETTPHFCNGNRHLGLGCHYHSGKVKIISPSFPGCVPGSMITFLSEQDNKFKSYHETNLQICTEERMVR